MSHISKIELEINDLAALKKACKRLGLTFCENQSQFVWFNGKESCHHAIRVPGAKYEVGLRKTGKAYEVLWDDWSGGGLQQKLGQGAGLLKQAYATERVKAEARRKRYRVREKQTEQGIRLEVML
jgi:hypothetical protein